MPGPMSSRALMRGRMQETVSVQRVLVVDREGNECGVKKGPITIFVRHRADCPCADDDPYKGADAPSTSARLTVINNPGKQQRLAHGLSQRRTARDRGTVSGRQSLLRLFIFGMTTEMLSTKLAQIFSDTVLLLIIKEKVLEARVGIEPTHKGFADLSLTTWVPRLGWAYFCPAEL